MLKIHMLYSNIWFAARYYHLNKTTRFFFLLESLNFNKYYQSFCLYLYEKFNNNLIPTIIQLIELIDNNIFNYKIIIKITIQMNKILSFLVIDSLDSLVLIEKFKKSFHHYHSKSLSLYYRKRVLEQIVNFIKINYLFFPNNSIFFLIINGFPFWFSSNNNRSKAQPSKIKKNLKHFIKYLEENSNLLFIDQEIDRIKKVQDTQKFSINVNLMFFIIYNLSIKLVFLDINVFNLVSNKNSVIDQKSFGETLTISRRMSCTFSFFALISDFPFFRFLAFFSNGFCGAPVEIITKLVYSNKFLQLLLSLFWVNVVNRELFLRSILLHPKLFNCKFSNLKNVWKCGYCKTIFKTIFSNCFLCGNSYLLQFN